MFESNLNFLPDSNKNPVKFYIASGIAHIETVRIVADYLKSRGWSAAYDWTTHGQVDDTDLLPSVSQMELEGVVEADIVIVILPGGRGTHVEFGAALARHKPILLLARDPFEGHLNDTCSFYYHPKVYGRIYGLNDTDLAFRTYREARKIVRSLKTECL